MELLTGKENLEKAKSLEVAEEAREESWKYPSFVGDLFTGKVHWELIFPYLALLHAEIARFTRQVSPTTRLCSSDPGRRSAAPSRITGMHYPLELGLSSPTPKASERPS